MVTLKVTKEQMLELFVMLNIKPNQLASIEQLEDLVIMRDLLRAEGGGFVKTVEKYDMDAVTWTRKAQVAQANKDEETLDEARFVINGLASNRREFVEKQREDVVEMVCEDKVFNSVRDAFNQIGKEAYSKQEGSLEAFVAMKKALDGAIVTAS